MARIQSLVIHSVISVRLVPNAVHYLVYLPNYLDALSLITDTDLRVTLIILEVSCHISSMGDAGLDLYSLLSTHLRVVQELVLVSAVEAAKMILRVDDSI